MALKDQPQLQETQLGQLTVRASDWAEKYGMPAAIGSLVLVIAVGAWIYFSGRSQEESETAWSRFARADSAEAFATIADDYPDHPVGAWARLAEGQKYLESGVAKLTTDRKEANGDLKKAKEAFKALSKIENVPPDVRVQAELCNAWLLEATCDGDTDKAVEAYAGFLKNNPDSIYEDYITKRIEALKTDDAKAFYAWFDEQTPDPKNQPLPTDGFPGMPPGHPEMPVALPPIPFELYPSDWDELKVGDLPELDGGEDEPEKESGEETPTEGTSTETKPEEGSEAKPEGGEKPEADATSDKDDASNGTPEKNGAAESAPQAPAP